VDLWDFLFGLFDHLGVVRERENRWYWGEFSVLIDFKGVGWDVKLDTVGIWSCMLVGLGYF
jgi:hypothetical protein